jgi:hypothetical protein
VKSGELAVLKSNDWNKYLPSFIAIEVHNFLVGLQYALVAKTQLTAIYKHKAHKVN